MTDLSNKSVSELEELNRLGLIRRDDIPEYNSWQNMKRRCNDLNNPAYNDYGGRGITIYELWEYDFWAWFHYVGRRPDEGYVLDRIDNDGSYVPGNLRWTTYKVSNNNKRKDKVTKLTMEEVEEIRSARGGPLTLRELGIIYGVEPASISAIQLGEERNIDGTYERPSKLSSALIGEQNPEATITETQAALIKGLLAKGL
jgi:hypothetical protein